MNVINMPITEARINLGAVVEKVRTNDTRIILEKGGIPVATIVNIEELENLYDTIELMQAREQTKDEPKTNWKDIREKYA
jgi:prevent-host-death family protein